MTGEVPSFHGLPDLFTHPFTIFFIQEKSFPPPFVGYKLDVYKCLE
jgi:hypothetical protein